MPEGVGQGSRFSGGLQAGRRQRGGCGLFLPTKRPRGPHRGPSPPSTSFGWTSSRQRTDRNLGHIVDDLESPPRSLRNAEFVPAVK